MEEAPGYTGEVSRLQESPGEDRASHAFMSDACDKIPHHAHLINTVVFFGIPTSSLDTSQKSCDNGEKEREDTPDDPKLTTNRSGFRRACVCMVNITWTRMLDSPREERRNHG